MATIDLALHSFEKSEHERNVRATFSLRINGAHKSHEHFAIPEKDLPAQWVEDDLIAWVNAKGEALGPAVRGPEPDPEPEPEPEPDAPADDDPE